MAEEEEDDNNEVIYKSMTLYEYPNKEVKDTIFRHEDIWDADRKRLRNFCRGQQSYPIPVQYIMDLPYGRYKLKDASMHTSMSMWKKIRSNLYGETEYDIDLKSAHFMILKQMIDIPLQNIDYYINNREEVINLFTINEKSLNEFNKINKDCKTKKDVVKQLYTTILYGGSYERLLKEFNFKKEDVICPPIHENICNDIKTAQILIKEKYNELFNNIKISLIDKLEKEHYKKENERIENDKRCKKIKPFDRKKVDIPDRKNISKIITKRRKVNY